MLLEIGSLYQLPLWFQAYQDCTSPSIPSSLPPSLLCACGMTGSLVVGGLTYALHFPERFAPGKFDVWVGREGRREGGRAGRGGGQCRTSRTFMNTSSCIFGMPCAYAHILAFSFRSPGLSNPLACLSGIAMHSCTSGSTWPCSRNFFSSSTCSCVGPEGRGGGPEGRRPRDRLEPRMGCFKEGERRRV